MDDAPQWHLAQFNVARLRAPIDDPLVAPFVAGVDPIDALADRSSGFVWRLQDESGNATGVRVSPDPQLIANLSVWESLEALNAFVYRTEHVEFLRRRREWFDKPERATLVMWWVPAGHVPDLAEAMARLDRVNAEGPSPEAFSFRSTFPPP